MCVKFQGLGTHSQHFYVTPTLTHKISPTRTGRALTFRKFPEKMDIGSKKMYLQEVCEGGQKNQGHVTFPRKSRAVVGDIRKNGQNFGDLNFHKI